MRRALALIALGICASHARAESADQRNLAAGAVEEACMRLASGEQVRYQFSATRDVRFNIHYHVGKEVRFIVPETDASERTGNAKAPESNDYCLMWENKSDAAAQITYRYEVMRKPLRSGAQY